MGKFGKFFVALAMFSMIYFGSCVCSSVSLAREQKKFTIAWSHYTGWEPIAYGEKFGIFKKWADRFGIEIDVVLAGYIESVNIYTAGGADACAITNTDALSILGVSGVDSTALIVGDFSNGNDGLATNVPGIDSIKDLKGKEIKLMKFSVSHYAFIRWLDLDNLRELDIDSLYKSLHEKDFTLVNVSDADIGGIFLSRPCNAVTWNPILMTIRNSKGTKVLADSSQIPGEIIDMIVVKTNTPDSFKKALTGAWFEIMDVMSGKYGLVQKEKCIKFMAENAGSTVDGFKTQLSTTAMFYEARDAVDFAESDKLKDTMEYVRTFSFDHGLYGEGAESKDLVGIQFPDGMVIGDRKNIKLRFDSAYMRMAADGLLR